jgi:hypothetical protein
MEEIVLEGEEQRTVAVEGQEEWKKRTTNFEKHSPIPPTKF